MNWWVPQGERIMLSFGVCFGSDILLCGHIE